MRRDRRIGIGIVAIGVVSLFAWLLLRNWGPETTPSTTVPAQSETRTVPVPQMPEANLKPIPLLKVPPRKPRTSLVAPTPPKAALTVTPACAVGKIPERPETGATIEPDVGNSGDSILEITNGTNLDAAVR